jgi:hypothetical protein
VRKVTVLFLALLIPAFLFGQQSTSHKLEEHVLNAGGLPLGGTIISSSSHRMTLGAIGQGVSFAAPASANFVMAPGFVTAYPPPGEVLNLRFTDSTTLAWDADPSVGGYNLYEGNIKSPFDTGYGTCATEGITTLSTTVSGEPVPNAGMFFLITAENRLREEGTKGTDDAGLERDNSNPCP